MRCQDVKISGPSDQSLGLGVSPQIISAGEARQLGVYHVILLSDKSRVSVTSFDMVGPRGPSSRILQFISYQIIRPAGEYWGIVYL